MKTKLLSVWFFSCLVLSFTAQAFDELDQQNLNVMAKIIHMRSLDDDHFYLQIKINPKIKVQRAGFRFSGDNWNTRKDYFFKRDINGEFIATIGPLQKGSEIQFAVFAEDTVAERWVWDNFFRQNHKIRIPFNKDDWSFLETHNSIQNLSYGKNDFIAEIEALKITKPKLNLRISSEANLYLSKHKLYLSMTTSPTRIDKIVNVLNSIDLTRVEKVFLNIPYRFGRDNSTYIIPQELIEHPKVVINRIEHDFGPISKILPALEKIQKSDPDAWIISIDDDIKYNEFLVRDFVNAKALNPDCVISGSGQRVDFWGLPFEKMPIILIITRTIQVQQG